MNTFTPKLYLNGEDLTFIFVHGGITCELYALDDIVNMPFFDRENVLVIKKFSIESIQKIKDSDKKVIVIEIDANECLDSWTINTPVWDKFGDVVRFYANPLRNWTVRSRIEQSYKLIRLAFPKAIFKANAHSLGTVQLLGANVELDEVVLSGCPIGFSIKPARDFVQSELRAFPWGPIKKRMFAKKLFYLYSDSDDVCDRPFPNDFAKAKAIEARQYRNGTGHSWKGYNQTQFENGILRELWLKR